MRLPSLNEELKSVEFGSYSEIFSKFRELSGKYGNLSVDSLITAFGNTTATPPQMLNNPYIQNRRVKGISSLPKDYTKNQVAEMIANPDGNERPLREVAHALEYTAYPMFHTRKVYQEMLTYHNYIAPHLADKEDAKKDDFWREWKLLEKIRTEIDPAANAHQIAGQALQEGKVFYFPRVSVDKPHNKVNHAFMQQLPSDWVKIVGFNNKSKYTIAFNLMYFLRPGTDIRQFGDLFEPFEWQFGRVIAKPPKGAGSTVVYASTNAIDMVEFKKLEDAGQNRGEPEVYYQNGTWFYWVTLPVDRVFTFEVDDVQRNVVTPFTGLFLNMLQLAQYEQIQLELVQNPLISIVTGEIPYRDDKDATTSDPYKLSNAGRRLFEALWYQMLTQNNTNGIGLYMAPLENITMHQLSEAPSAMEISTNGYGYTMAKAGLSALIPTSDEPRAGVAQISLQIESRFAQNIYRDFERMMRCIFDRLNLKYSWKFKMFGDLATDKDLEERSMKGMEHGILPDTLIYLALHDRSLLDDISISDAIVESDVMNKRLPLISGYSMKQENSGLPPQAAHDQNPGGRPSSDGQATSDGQEGDLDSYGE